MKMIHKMILLFSLTAILTTAANSIYFYNIRMADLDQRTYEHLNTLGAKIVGEIEQYVKLMDYAIESLTADTDFMEAFHRASHLDDESDVGETLAIQNILSRKLYQEPILEPFFRVSVYSKSGFFLSSRFEKTESVTSMSDEAKATISSLPYRSLCDAQPFRRHIVGPHKDPWTEEFVGVFSAVRSVAWRGEPTGYVEVNAYLDDLAEMFMWQKHDGFLVQGIFDNGEQLFRNQGDDVIYSDLNPSGLTRAIRKLTKRVKHLPVDSILTHSDEALTATVTHPRDREIHKLETTMNRLIAKLQSSMNAQLVLREGALQAQLNALQMQINPHFIYNTLNIISAKGMECGSEEIMDICDQFAQMLRYATDLRAKTATLGDELQNARRYLQLVKVRYEDQLTYTIDVPESMNHLLLPKLSLQPIVENALTHGFAGRTDPREVSITSRVTGSRLYLTIRDNGNGFSEDSLLRLHGAFAEMEKAPTDFASEGGEHLGLINTYLRLLNASKGRIRMTLHNDSGAVITLTLPVEQENHHV